MSREGMELTKVREELKALIIESLELDNSSEEIIGEDLINELGINSVDALEIFVRVENKFDIIISDEDLSSELISSLDGFAQYIIGRCG